MTQNIDFNQGILLIDKPTSWTSFDVVAKVRRLTGVKRVGHAGTLDPLATGLLIVLVGRNFTKIQDKFLKQDKTYLCTALLGFKTDTYDIDGQVIGSKDWKSYQDLSKVEISKALSKFQGQIVQTVPPYSAVKKNGQKLYDLARKGKIDLENLPQRKVEIKKIELLSMDKNVENKNFIIELKIDCSSGTYIRSLVNDLGNELGCLATVKTLRRIRIGELDISQAQKIDQPLHFME